MSTPTQMRDKAEASAKAGKYGDAMEAYFAAEKLYRDQKSPAAADSMAAAAKQMAIKAKAVKDKGGDPYAKKAQTEAETDKSISDLKKWAMGTNPAYAKSVKDAAKKAAQAKK